LPQVIHESGLMSRFQRGAIFALVLAVSAAGCMSAAGWSGGTSWQHGTIRVDGASLYYEVEGRGEMLVVLHGGPGSEMSYIKTYLEDLSKDFRVFFYDQRGRGRSAAGGDSLELSIQQDVEDLEELRLRLGIDRLNLLGHSWGGVLAMFYACAHPHSVGKLILVDSGGPRDDWAAEFSKNVLARLSDEELGRREAIWKSSRAAEDRDWAFTEDFKVIMPAYFHDPAKIDTTVYPRLSIGVHRAVWNSAQGYDLRECLRLVRVPALVMVGRYDPLPMRCSEEIASVLRGSRLVVFESSGHLPFVEERGRFLEEVRRFLRQGR